MQEFVGILFFVFGGGLNDFSRFWCNFVFGFLLD